MSHGRKTKGVHQLFTYAQAQGNRWITCACGRQYVGPDPDEVWALYLQHTQDPAHR